MHLRGSEIARWLRGQVAAARADGLVVGLSGGLDSAVVAGLCRTAMPDRVAALILPCGSDPADEADARLAAAHFGIPVAAIDLGPAWERLAADLVGAVSRLGVGAPAAGADNTEAARANMKPRLRMTALYFVANALNYLVAGTANRCELTVGYFTKHGDGASDVLPLGNLLKRDVRALARDLGVPDAILDKPPSAGLRPGQTDEEDLGFTYASLERYLTDGPEAVSPAFALRIERMIRTSEHKRVPPPAPDSAAAEPADEW